MMSRVIMHRINDPEKRRIKYILGEFVGDGKEFKKFWTEGQRLWTMVQGRGGVWYLLNSAFTQLDAAVFDEAHNLYEGGGFAGPESYQIHRKTLESHRELYDPNVAARIDLGAAASAADYVQRKVDRDVIIQRSSELLAPYDAMLLPTTACVAPTIAEVDESMEAYARMNLLLLRNTGLINMLDGCALSLPCHAKGEPPVGLMVAGMGGADTRVLAAGLAIEAALEDALGPVGVE